MNRSLLEYGLFRWLPDVSVVFRSELKELLLAFLLFLSCDARDRRLPELLFPFSAPRMACLLLAGFRTWKRKVEEFADEASLVEAIGTFVGSLLVLEDENP